MLKEHFSIFEHLKCLFEIKLMQCQYFVSFSAVFHIETYLTKSTPKTIKLNQFIIQAKIKHIALQPTNTICLSTLKLISDKEVNL